MSASDLRSMADWLDALAPYLQPGLAESAKSNARLLRADAEREALLAALDAAKLSLYTDARRGRR